MYLLICGFLYLIIIAIYCNYNKSKDINTIKKIKAKISDLSERMEELKYKMFNHSMAYNDFLKQHTKLIDQKEELLMKCKSLEQKHSNRRDYIKVDTGIAICAVLISLLMLVISYSDYIHVNSILEQQHYLESVNYDNAIDNGLVNINKEIFEWNKNLIRCRENETNWFIRQFTPKIYLEEDGYGFHLIEYKVKN